MAGKRSYLDSNANYTRTKAGMRGMGTAGGDAELPEEEQQRRRLINAILESPDLEKISRRWQLGTFIKTPNDETKGYWNKEPVGTFDDFVDHYNSTEAQLGRAKKRKNFGQGYSTEASVEYLEKRLKYEKAKLAAEKEAKAKEQALAEKRKDTILIKKKDLPDETTIL